MARDFATAFYHSPAWKRTRAAYVRQVRGLCERCKAQGRWVPGEIVHHKVHLTPQNIGDPRVTLSFSNLELLCRKCHAEEHPEIYGDSARPMRVTFDESGDVRRG